MRIGSVCYATSRGLGHLCKDFYAHGLINDVLVVEHPGVPTNRDWYPGAPVVPLRGISTHESLIREFCTAHDAMLFFETPFYWPLLTYCREKGIPTYLVTMYECTPQFHGNHPPSVYLCPSRLDCDYFVNGAGNGVVHKWREYPGVAPGSRAVWVQLPVEYPWKLRERARHFVHNGGYLGVRAKGGVMREGTTTLVEAMQHVKSPIKLTIRVQENVPESHRRMCERDGRIEYVPENVPYEELYGTGDVCVGAQRWNGCSLPLQEAFASGMCVINTDRYPMNTWLPTAPLVPVRSWIQRSSIGGPYLEFVESVVTPIDLAAAIDKWYDKDVTEFSFQGRYWAECNGWDALLPRWREVLRL